MEQSNVRYMFVSNYTGATALAQGTRLKEVSDLSDGEMVVVNAENVVLSSVNIESNTSAENNGVQIAYRVGDELFRTPLLKAANKLSYQGSTALSATNQITYIGYEGSGSNDLKGFTAGDVLTPRIEFYEDSRQQAGNRHLETTAYEVQAGDTAFEVALGIANGLQKTFNRKENKPIKTEVLGSVVDLEVEASPSTYVKAWNGESFIESDNNSLASGHVIRMGGTATNVPVYKIVSADTANNRFKLDRPYEGVDANHNTTASYGYTGLAAAQASAVNWGVKLTGLDKKFKIGKYPYGVYRFDAHVDADDLSGTIVNTSQEANPGRGEGKAVAENEWLYQGNEGATYKRDFVHEEARSIANTAYNYDQIAIRAYNDKETSAVSYVRSPIEVILAFKTGYTNGQMPDEIAEALDAYFSGTSGLNVS